MVNFKQYFIKHGKCCAFNKGEVIVDCSLMPNGIYYIEKGFIKTLTLTERGNEHIYIIYKPNDIIPARWAFSAIKGHLIYMAMTPVTAWKVDKSSFSAYISSSPEILNAALEYSNTILNIFVNRVNDLEHMNAYLRVMAALLRLSTRFGKAKGHGVLIDLPITHQELGSALALTRETVSREIGKLIDKQIIKYNDNLIFINKIEELEKEMSEYKT
jgi:CRP/FNR family transcriptional regulator